MTRMKKLFILGSFSWLTSDLLSLFIPLMHHHHIIPLDSSGHWCVYSLTVVTQGVTPKLFVCGERSSCDVSSAGLHLGSYLELLQIPAGYISPRRWRHWLRITWLHSQPLSRHDKPVCTSFLVGNRCCSVTVHLEDTDENTEKVGRHCNLFLRSTVLGEMLHFEQRVKIGQNSSFP